MIDVRNLTKQFRVDSERLIAVDNVTFSVKKGEMLSIAGHSGSGKTTLLNLIGGLTRPDSGEVLIDGENIWTMGDNALSALRNNKIGFIYQFASLIPTLTAIENIILPTSFGSGGGAGQDYAMELLKVVGLEEKRNAYPSSLSGGQQRRIAIARSFINKPSIVLADEPTGDLDEETESEIMGLFHRMNRENGIIFILVTHSMEIARQAGRQMKMTAGVLSEIS